MAMRNIVYNKKYNKILRPMNLPYEFTILCEGVNPFFKILTGSEWTFRQQLTQNGQQLNIVSLIRSNL